MTDFLLPILDGFGWTFRLIGGGTTGALILGAVTFGAIWFGIGFWRKAHWQPGVPMDVATVEILKAARKRAEAEAPESLVMLERPGEPVSALDDPTRERVYRRRR